MKLQPITHLHLVVITITLHHLDIRLTLIHLVFTVLTAQQSLRKEKKGEKNLEGNLIKGVNRLATEAKRK